MAVDLFTPVVPEEQFHPNFRAAIHEASSGERAVLEDWAKDFVDRDGKFVKEFQLTFNTAYWELYLHAAFRQLGFVTDWRHASPDFVLSKGAERFIVEATSANAAEGKPKEWEKDFSPDALAHSLNIPEINREAIIRLSNSIHAKHRKYIESYRKLSHVSGKPYVIAVGPFEQPYFFLQHDRPIKALLYDYYVDEEEYKKDPAKHSNGPPGIRLGTITKDNGNEIELGFFNSSALEEISAVIFTCTATWGKLNALSSSSPKRSFFDYMRYDEHGVPQTYREVSRENYTESLLDGLQVYHNPYAKYPLSTALLRAKDVVQVSYNEESEEWIHEGIPGSLTWRRVTGKIPRSKKVETA